MGQGKKVQFSVTRTYLVEIDESTLVRQRVRLREEVPDTDWAEDEAVINAIVEDYECVGDHDDFVAGPFVTVTKLRQSTKPRP